MVVDFDDTDFDMIVSAQVIEQYKLMRCLRGVLEPVRTQDCLTNSDRHRARTSGSTPLVRKNERLDRIARKTIGGLVARSFTKEELLGIPELDISEYIDEKMLTISDVIEPDGPPIDEDTRTKDIDAGLPRILGDGPLYEGIRALCRRYHGIFSRTVRAQPAELPGYVLLVDKDKWTRVAAQRGPRKHPPDRRAEIERQVKLMLDLGIISQVHNVAHYSQVLLVPKPGGKWRFCIDYRPLNAASGSNAGHPLPRITELLRRLGTRTFKFLAKMDLTSGYHQCAMDPATKHFAAFVTESGIYVPNRLMFGVKCAPSYFQGHMAKTVLSGINEHICEAYIDDIITWGNTIEEFLLRLESIFKRFQQYGITVNPDKCELGISETQFLGHLLNNDGLTLAPDKVRRVLDFPLPKSIKEMRSFIGLVNYFANHIDHCSAILRPLQDMVTEATQQYGNRKSHLKVKITRLPINSPD